MKVCSACGACLVIFRNEKVDREGVKVRLVTYGCPNRRCGRYGERQKEEKHLVKEENNG